MATVTNPIRAELAVDAALAIQKALSLARECGWTDVSEVLEKLADIAALRVRQRRV